MSSVGHLRSPKKLWGRFYPPRQGLKFESCLGRQGFPLACVKGRVPLPSGLDPTLGGVVLQLKSQLTLHTILLKRKQNSSPLELPLDVEEGVFNDEVQQNEATQLTDQEIALDASSDGSLSSGEQRRDYMMSSGAEDDQTGEGGSMSHGYTYY
ncbi:hypothetical protein Tco_1239291 [Tanacetum coccineum]